ncbi:MAG: DUF488 family protein [Thermoplasmata archaeon]
MISGLRKWFSHDKLKWNEFLEKYEFELNNNHYFKEFFNKIQEMLSIRDIIFLYASKEKEFNNANALKIIIEKKFKQYTFYIFRIYLIYRLF